MSFLYPRTVSVYRPTQVTGAGVVAYGGQTPALMDSVASNLPASIQIEKVRGSEGVGLPTDSAKTQWRVMMPASVKALIQTRDVLVDDLGVRYQVAAPHRNPLGLKIICELLET